MHVLIRTQYNNNDDAFPLKTAVPNTIINHFSLPFNIAMMLMIIMIENKFPLPNESSRDDGGLKEGGRSPIRIRIPIPISSKLLSHKFFIGFLIKGARYTYADGFIYSILCRRDHHQVIARLVSDG